MCKRGEAPCRGEVRSLAFGDNNTVMVVELGLHEVVSRKVIARAEKQIADTYGLDRVMIEPRYNMPGELSNEYIKSLYGRHGVPHAVSQGSARSHQVGICGRRAPDTDGRGERKAFRKRTAASGGAYSAGAGPQLSGATRSARTHRILHPHPSRRRAARKFCTRLWSKRRQPQRKRPSRKSRVRRRSSTQAISARRTEKVREDDLIFGKLIQDPIVSGQRGDCRL